MTINRPTLLTGYTHFPKLLINLNDYLWRTTIVRIILVVDFLLNRIYNDEWLPDRSGNPAVSAANEELQRIAGTKADICINADGPKKLK